MFNIDTDAELSVVFTEQCTASSDIALKCGKKEYKVINRNNLFAGNTAGNVTQNRSNQQQTIQTGRPQNAPKRNYSTQNQPQQRPAVLGNNQNFNRTSNNTNSRSNGSASNRGRGRGRGSNSLLGPPVKPFQPDEPDGQAIVCNCGIDAPIRTVRKEGPNTGKCDLWYFTKHFWSTIDIFVFST